MQRVARPEHAHKIEYLEQNLTLESTTKQRPAVGDQTQRSATVSFIFERPGYKNRRLRYTP